MGEIDDGLIESQVLDDEGLPIREIREAPDGTTLSDLTPAIPGEAPVEGQKNVDLKQESVRDHGTDFWSEAAKARREALRKRIFNERDSSDEEMSSKTGSNADEAVPQAQPEDDQKLVAPPKAAGITTTSPPRQQLDVQAVSPTS